MIIFDSGLTGLIIRQWRSRVFMDDDFLTGTVSSGTVGKIGWGLGGGTITNQQSETNHPGILRLDTTTTSATVSRIFLNAQISTVLLADRLRLGAYIRLNQVDANTTARVGWMSNTSGNPPTNWFGLEKADADTDWFLVSKVGGGTTRTDSGVAVGTGWVFLETYLLNSVIYYWINGTLINTVTTNVPATSSPGTFVIQIVNSTTASKTLDIDYAYLSANTVRP